MKFFFALIIFILFSSQVIGLIEMNQWGIAISMIGVMVSILCLALYLSMKRVRK